MPSYITITDPETDPEAPLTSELAKKWRDNPIAIAEGDPTAVAAGVTVRLPALQRLQASNVIRLREDATVVVSNTSYSNLQDYPYLRIGTTQGLCVHTFMQAGTLRFFCQHRTINAFTPSEVRLRRIRAGVETTVYASPTTTSTAFVDRTFDFDIQPGDVFGVQARQTNPTHDGEIRSVRYQGPIDMWIYPTFTMAGLLENNPTI